MKSTRFRALLVAALFALLASACGGSDSTSPDAAGNATTEADSGDTADAALGVTPVPNPDGTDTDSSDAGDAEAGDESGDAGDDAAPPAAPFDPQVDTTNFVRALFNVEPSAEAVDCILNEAEQRPNLDEAIRAGNPVFASFGDDLLYDVTTSLNGCVDPLSLGGWAMEAAGPTGEVRETAPACFAEDFADPELGDELFHTFVALSFQYRYDPEVVPAMTDTLARCVPVTGLAPFFANQAEAESNYETVIDRECFVERVGDPAVSEEFWATLIDGSSPPTLVVQPYLAECAEILHEDLLDAVPADFEAWSGTGALAGVAPPARVSVYSASAPMTIDPAGTYTAVLATGGGEIRIRLFADSAPVTVNNFVMLARDGYYDQTVFHRVLADFMAQGGDPTGTGTGGPGYIFEDETEGGPPLDRAGLLAMANTGADSNGSQFFITFAPTEWLTGNHTVFGEVIEGMEIVDAIQLRNPDFPEGRGQILESVTIVEG
ncbi:MAG: peptidylprolyl isomerase [Actinomycetota bacterium]